MQTKKSSHGSPFQRRKLQGTHAGQSSRPKSTIHRFNLTPSKTTSKTNRKVFTGEDPRIDDGFTLFQAYLERGKLLMHVHKYSLALLDYQAALKEGPASDDNKIEIYINMGICYKGRGEEKKADIAFGVAEKLSVNDKMKQQRVKESKQAKYEGEDIQENKKSK